ncbi:MAG: class I SAM-dependent methyltransferase [Methylococcaceae bacterium]|jgi:SAM-dependent methyltransferase
MLEKIPGKSLDLGCNNLPRNPYNYAELYGIDLPDINIPNVTYIQANLSLENIPFENNFFDSVTAFDFIEHIPRQILSLESKSTRLPFIELMNEIWRVLKPNGKFYALTPVYPSPAAFQDPTHVNFITRETHNYFCGLSPLASIYGFKGQFTKVRVQTVVPKTAFSAEQSRTKFLYNLQKRIINPKRLSHILWELSATK